MNRTVLITLISAVLIAGLIGVAAVMFMRSDDDRMNHRMDDGSTMTGATMTGTTMTGMMNSESSP